jgi:hypothetical protein
MTPHDPEFVAWSSFLAVSYKRWTGALLTEELDPVRRAEALYRAPFVLVSHGTQADPVLNYGNLAAQKLWELNWAELTRMPSRLTAEQPERSEREQFLLRVSTHGYISDYSGIRVTSAGLRFRIRGAVVWNVEAGAGNRVGQAAMFRDWEWLEGG